MALVGTGPYHSLLQRQQQRSSPSTTTGASSRQAQATLRQPQQLAPALMAAMRSGEVECAALHKPLRATSSRLPASLGRRRPPCMKGVGPALQISYLTFAQRTRPPLDNPCRAPLPGPQRRFALYQRAPSSHCLQRRCGSYPARLPGSIPTCQAFYPGAGPALFRQAGFC